jgi:hypothetical protein
MDVDLRKSLSSGSSSVGWKGFLFGLLSPEDKTDSLPETSVTNYRYSLRNNPEECSSQPFRGGSLQSRIHYILFKKKCI